MPQPALYLPLDHLLFKNPGNSPTPFPVDYMEAARQLKPLIERLVNGDELTPKQLSTIVVDSWRVSEGARNLLQTQPRQAEAVPASQHDQHIQHRPGWGQMKPS